MDVLNLLKTGPAKHSAAQESRSFHMKFNTLQDVLEIALYSHVEGASSTATGAVYQGKFCLGSAPRDEHAALHVDA